MTTSPDALDTSRTIARMQAAMHALFVVLLAVGLVRAVVGALNDSDPHGLHGAARAAVIIIATAGFVALYLSGLLLERRARRADGLSGVSPMADTPATSSETPTTRPVVAPRRKRATPNVVWIIALVVAWMGLLVLARDFAWLAFALYFLVLHVAPRAVAAPLVVAVLAGSVIALAASPETRGAGAVIGPFMGMVVALGIAWVYAQLRRESEARRALVGQLVAAQDDVLATQGELARTQREAGVLAERERLAHDIHDTLAQDFSSIVLLSRAGLARDPDDAVLQQIERQAAEGLTQAREVVHALAPTELADAPLFTALVRLAERLREQTGLDVQTHRDGDARPLGAELDVTLLRIAQGALANVRLHAQATRAGLTLTYDPAAVTLEIIDDGVGFTDDDVARAPLGGNGFGLRAIRERVEAGGGELTIESAPGDGTALLVRMPTPTRHTASTPSNTSPPQSPSAPGTPADPTAQERR